MGLFDRLKGRSNKNTNTAGNDSLSPENQQKYEELAKSISLLIRYSNYVNIDNLYEIMAESNPFSHLILKEYSKTYNFKEYNIINAMNLFMSTFGLRGESYNIYNFICAFGSKSKGDLNFPLTS